MGTGRVYGEGEQLFPRIYSKESTDVLAVNLRIYICSGEFRREGLSVTEHTLSVHSTLGILVPRTAAAWSGFPAAPLTPVSPRALHHHWVAQGLRFIDHFRKVFMPTCQEKVRINKVLATGQRLAQHLPP